MKYIFLVFAAVLIAGCYSATGPTEPNYAGTWHEAIGSDTLLINCAQQNCILIDTTTALFSSSFVYDNERMRAYFPIRGDTLWLDLAYRGDTLIGALNHQARHFSNPICFVR